MPRKVLAVLPIYFQEEATIACLRSFRETSLTGIELKVVLAVNGATPSLQAYLDSVVGGTQKDFPDKAEVVLRNFPGNPGKGFVVNQSVKEFESWNPEFVLSYDSDLIIQEPSWLTTLVFSFDKASSLKRLGAVVSAQTVGDVHRPVSPQIVKVSGTNLLFSSCNQGQAGSCLMTPLKVWKELGGYRTDRVYGGIDGDYMSKLHMHKYVSCIAQDCVLIHPHSTDVAYSHWKLRAAYGKLGENEKGGYYK